MRICILTLYCLFASSLLSGCAASPLAPPIPVPVTPSTSLGDPSPQPIAVSSCPPTSPAGDPRDEIHYMVRLLNEHAYQAAFQRWHDAPTKHSLSAFEAHFQSIQIITATLQMAHWNAAAGSIYAPVSTHLRIQDITGQVREEAGCIVLSRSNPDTDGADPGDWWQIDSSMSSVPLFSTADPDTRQITPDEPCWGASPAHAMPLP